MKAQSQTDGILSTTVKLNSPQRWSEWITLLESFAKIRRLWDKIDPSQPPQEDDHNLPPEVITVERAREIAPSYGASSTPTFEQLIAVVNAEKADFTNKRLIYVEREKNEQTIRTWIAQTVETSIYSLVTSELAAVKSDFSIRELLKGIKKQIAPSHSNMLQAARQFYKDTLQEAFQANTRPDTWYIKWLKAYHDGSHYKIPEIEGTMAIRDFLHAVGARMAPDWAQTIETDLIRIERRDDTPQSVLEYAAEFNAYMQTQSQHQRTKGAYATLNESSETRSRSPTSQKECPCGRDHNWKPIDCYAVQNTCTGRGRLTIGQRNRIRQRIIDNDKYSDLRQALKDKGLLQEQKNPSLSSSIDNGRSKKGPPNNVIAVTIDPMIAREATIHPEAVYTSIGSTRHPLSDSTLLDNCGAMHLVNDSRFLIPGSFRPDKEDNFVEAGASQFKIIGRGKRIMKKIFMDANGNETIDLTLNNVAVVPDFHVNIVSEALLLEAGVWIIGKDCSLRYGDFDSNTILKRLVRKHNLTFLEFKGSP